MDVRTVEEMELVVEQYIYDRKGISVNIDIQLHYELMPPVIRKQYLIDQVIKLNNAYDVAVKWNNEQL